MTTSPAVERDAGMAAAECAADPRLIAMIDAIIHLANTVGIAWSANDIRDRLPVAAAGLVGARVKAASMRKPREMVPVGSTQSTLPSTHCKEIKVWVGVT